MSSRQRKRPGGAVDSRPAQKRSRLLPSSAGGTSQTEPIDLEERPTLSLEPGEEVIDLTGEEEVIDIPGEGVIDLTGEEEVIDIPGEGVIDLTGEEDINLPGEGVTDLTGGEVIDLTGDSFEPEVIIISDDESAVDPEQTPQQPHLSRASENSAEPLARDNEEESRYFDEYDSILYEIELPYWSDEDSEEREQNQQHQHVSSAAENSADVLAGDDEEEPRDVDGAQPAYPASPLTSEDEDSEDWELPPFFRAGENSAELPARNDEEEPRDNQGAQPAAPASPLTSEDEDSEFLEVHEQERRNVTLNSHEQVDGSGNGTGANDAPVAESAPEEQGAEEEETASSDAEPGVVIRCPICMDLYSEIMRRGRQLMSTMCGHVFCSRCLPVALEAAGMCPTCREELSPELYHPIYL